MTDHEDLIRRLETPYPAGRWMSNGTTVDPACLEAATAIKELVAERDSARTRMEGLVNNLSFRIAEAKDWKDRAEKAEFDLAAARAAIRALIAYERNLDFMPEDEHAPAIAAARAEGGE